MKKQMALHLQWGLEGTMQTVIKSELNENAVCNCNSLCWQKVVHELKGKKSTSDELTEDV